MLVIWDYLWSYSRDVLVWHVVLIKSNPDSISVTSQSEDNSLLSTNLQKNKFNLHERQVKGVHGVPQRDTIQ